MDDLIPQIALQQDEDEAPPPFRLLTLVQKADEPNQNRRVYPRKVLEQQVEIFQEYIKNRSAMGELGIPSDARVQFANVSHHVVDLYMSEGNMMAEIELLNTPPGQQLRALLSAGVPIGFRMSGVGGGTTVGGNFVVDESYKLIQIFACSNPA